MKPAEPVPKAVAAAEAARKAALEAELNLILSTKVPAEQVKIQDVFISETEYIHTIQVGQEKITKKEGNNVILFLHGYGAPAASYFRLLPFLAKDFHVILADLPGMNFSTRLKDKPFDSLETCLKYCIDRIEGLIFALKLDFFHLVGHSIGGFLSGHVFKRLHEKILRVILLSPAGVNHPEPDQLGASLKKNAGKNIFKRIFISNFLHNIFEKKCTPLQYFKIGYLQRAMIHFYVSNKRFEFSQLEKQCFKTMSNYFISLPQCGEYIVCYLMHYGPKSKSPLIDFLPDFKDRYGDFLFIYGDRDILDHQLTIERFGAAGIDIKITYLMKADHQLIFQNVETLCKMIGGHIRHETKTVSQIITSPQEMPLDKQVPCPEHENMVYQLLEEESVNSLSRPETPKPESIAKLSKEEEDEIRSEALEEAARVTGSLIL